MNDEDFKQSVLQRLTALETKVESILDNHLVAIKDSINKIWNRISISRPSWAILVIITFLCSVCSALVVRILR